MSDEQAEVKQALQDYVADFSTLDLDVYLRHYHMYKSDEGWQVAAMMSRTR